MKGAMGDAVEIGAIPHQVGGVRQHVRHLRRQPAIRAGAQTHDRQRTEGAHSATSDLVAWRAVSTSPRLPWPGIRIMAK
ncbi:hypothetical protein [Nitrospirillum sp. BR 11828]|uniref:hypothetical protein n=1 Tax=Nitrospirillum sp. BR 11828 TaxID=3104325 RepID=UPI003A1030F3